MKNYSEIIIPKETVSDESVSIVEINSSSGTKVSKGEVIFSIETSKNVIEVETPISGIITHKLKLYENIPVGELAAVVSNNKLPTKTSEKLFDCNQLIQSNNNSKNNINIYNNFSKKALELIQKEGLDIDEFSNIPFVRVKDVEAFRLKEKTSLSHNEDINVKYDENDIIIIGGGGHAKMCIDIIKRSNIYQPIGILDSKLNSGEEVYGVPIIGADDHLTLLDLYKKGLRLGVNGVGSIKERTNIFKKLKEIGFSFPKIIHPMAIIEPSAVINEGAQIMMGASIGSGCKIGENSIINSGSILSHDSIIGKNSHIAPGAILAGNVQIGNRVLIGMGVTIFISSKIGDNVIVNNGVHIFSDVEKNEIVKNKDN